MVVEAVRTDELEALPLLKDITELYRIEREADARGFSARQRGYWRDGLAKPVLKRLQRRLLARSTTALPASKLGGAVTHAKNRWAHLAGYALAAGLPAGDLAGAGRLGDDCAGERAEAASSTQSQYTEVLAHLA